MRRIVYCLLLVLLFGNSAFAQQRRLAVYFAPTSPRVNIFTPSQPMMFLYLTDFRLPFSLDFTAGVTTSDDKLLKSDAQIIAKKLEGYKPDTKFILVADRKSGQVAMEIVDQMPGKLAGVVMLSAIPITRTTTGVDLWAPRAGAWEIPFWVTASNDASKASQCLLMWRKISSLQPAGANFTIDPVYDPAKPSDTINQWVKSILNGKTPARSYDSQEAAERQRYTRASDSLKKQVKRSGSALPGKVFTKIDGPFKLSGYVPQGWFRVTEGEKKYQKGVRDYTQVFCKASGDQPRSARVLACMGHEKPEQILDDYEKYLKQAGFVVIRYKRWKSSDDKLMQINSILWPAGGKWHRWLLLCGTPGQNPVDKTAPIVIVQDGSKKPDLKLMASSFKRFMEHAETALILPEKLIQNDR